MSMWLAGHTLLLVFLGAFCLFGQGNGALNQAQKNRLLELHNLRRRQVQPQAANMKELRWDDRIASIAERYALRCRFQHSTGTERRQDFINLGGPSISIGENIYTHTSADGNTVVESSMTFYWNERTSYNYGANTCDPGQQCSHYTQMVWADTELLGCGMHRCPTLPPFRPTSPATFIICQYGPSGNVFTPGAGGVLVPLLPYVAGTPCSRCPANFQCNNGLCAVQNSALEARVVNMENRVRAAEQELANFQPLPRPSAHLNGGTNQVTTVVGFDDVRFWNANDGHLEGGFRYSNGALFIPRAGYYFVYAQIWNFQQGSARHFVYVNGRRLMVSGTSRAAGQATWTGGVFFLNANEGLTVRLGLTSTQVRTVWPGRAHTYFGAFMM